MELQKFDPDFHINALIQIWELCGDLANTDIGLLEDNMAVANSKTYQGFFLEMYYDHPILLWTPWGSLLFPVIVGKDQIDNKLLSALGAQLYKGQAGTWLDQIGPIYAITKINNLELPKAEEAPTNSNFNIHQARDQWHQALQKYREQQTSLRTAISY